MLRRLSLTVKNATATSTRPSDSQSTSFGYLPVNATAESTVAAVPATSDVRRFTSPAKVAVRPLNMKMKTEKNATAP